MPKVSICIPVYDMEDRKFFLSRCLNSIKLQTFTDYEIVITEEGKMAENTNAAIKEAKGEIIKILFMDDYLADENSLKRIVSGFKRGWLATGCYSDDRTKIGNPHLPKWNDMIYRGYNTIGSPSVIAFENNKPLLFNKKLSWMLDCDLYQRLFDRYGLPTLLDSIDVVIGIGTQQATYLLTNEEKQREVDLMIEKYK